MLGVVYGAVGVSIPCRLRRQVTLGIVHLLRTLSKIRKLAMLEQTNFG